MRWAISGLLIGVAFTGCVSVNLQKLPAYKAAQQTERHPEGRVLSASAVNWDKMPAATPYAILQGDGNSWATVGMVKNRIREKGQVEKADFITLGPCQTYTSGFTHQYWGFGVTTSRPVKRKTISAVLWRINPSLAGIRWDKEGMVMQITRQNVREIGLREGDVLLSLAGAPVGGCGNSIGCLSRSSRIGAALLKKKPGDKVKVTWLRPGKGKTEAAIKMGENPKASLFQSPKTDNEIALR